MKMNKVTILLAVTLFILGGLLIYNHINKSYIPIFSDEMNRIICIEEEI